MELKEFIKEALLSISGGVNEANIKNNRYRIIGTKRNIGNVDGSFVYFDVLVAVQKKFIGKVGAKVDSSLLNVVSANINSKIDQSDSHQNVNRLKFKVWVSENDLKQTNKSLAG